MVLIKNLILTMLMVSFIQCKAEDSIVCFYNYGNNYVKIKAKGLTRTVKALKKQSKVKYSMDMKRVGKGILYKYHIDNILSLSSDNDYVEMIRGSKKTIYQLNCK